MKRKESYLSLLQPAKLKMILSFGIKGYLHDIGWFNSFRSRMPVDQNNDPIPWVTYSFIDFIKTRIQNTHTIFEFGSGNSTFFYAKHAHKVVSVEHDKAWFDKIVKQKPGNSEMIFCKLADGGDYCRVPQTRQEKFHIIIVDGRDRVNCCKQCLPALTDDGVVVLDDSERPQYMNGIKFLEQNGFKELRFTGISPGSFIYKATSVFYKPNNCLGV
ncbi:MAG TPA: FkbM family methyltransferase [Sphingobacteriaceae bacterium]